MIYMIVAIVGSERLSLSYSSMSVAAKAAVIYASSVLSVKSVGNSLITTSAADDDGSGIRPLHSSDNRGSSNDMA